MIKSEHNMALMLHLSAIFLIIFISPPPGIQGIKFYPYLYVQHLFAAQ